MHCAQNTPHSTASLSLGSQAQRAATKGDQTACGTLLGMNRTVVDITFRTELDVATADRVGTAAVSAEQAEQLRGEI